MTTARVASPALIVATILWALMPAVAAGQVAEEGTPTHGPGQEDGSRVWVVVGGTWTVLQGDCRTCSHASPYHQRGSLLSKIGFRVNSRMHAGAEVFWIPAGPDPDQRMRTTSVSAVAQFRPWASSGFFVNGGMGMARVRNWVYNDEPSVTAKALAMSISAGWEFRRAHRLGFEVFGSQRVTALGDLVTAQGPVENIVGNYWSIGAAVVLR